MKSVHGWMQRTTSFSHMQNTGFNSSKIQFNCTAVGVLRGGLPCPQLPPPGLQCPRPPPPPRAFTCTPWQPLLGLRVTVFTASLSLGTPRSSLLCSGYTVRFFLKQTEVVQKSFVNTSHISLVLQSTCWSPSLLGGKGRQNVFHTLVLLAA